MLTLEFFAHELFARDASAIREFLYMGRKELALMTATEEPEAIPESLPVLNEMASSDDVEVSTAIRKYLVIRSHHAGLALVRARVDVSFPGPEALARIELICIQ